MRRYYNKGGSTSNKGGGYDAGILGQLRDATEKIKKIKNKVFPKPKKPKK